MGVQLLFNDKESSVRKRLMMNSTQDDDKLKIIVQKEKKTISSWKWNTTILPLEVAEHKSSR